MLRSLLVSVLLGSLLFVACRQDETALQRQAITLSQQFIIVDGHIDVPYRLRNNMEDISQNTMEGDFDYVRARQGGLNAPFMSIYIPASYQEDGGAKDLADSLIAMMDSVASASPEEYAIATNREDIRRHFEEGIISLPMGIENGAAIEGDLDNLSYFYDKGIRYMTLTHSLDNRIGDSSYDDSETHGGLTDFGRDVVREMNRLGMLVDVSHISDNTFDDVLEVTEAPVIASHSSLRHFTPGFERNMSDNMVERLADNGGIIMINFGSSFISQESRESADRVRDEIDQWIEENDLDPDDPEAEEYSETYFEENYRYATTEEVADHIDRAVELAGIDYIGLGSDYDGVGNTLPEGLKDASAYPNLFRELLKRGYTEEDIAKISYRNFFRVWEQADSVAQRLQQEN
ncbi:MAG: dipeptidase [Balneolaceae bacterium]